MEKPWGFEPISLAGTPSNIVEAGTTSGGVNSSGGFYANLVIVLTHIRVVNTTSGAVPISMFIGASGGSAAGTEFGWAGEMVPAHDHLDWFGEYPLYPGQFLTALAGTASVLTITGEGYIQLA